MKKKKKPEKKARKKTKVGEEGRRLGSREGGGKRERERGEVRE